MKAAQEIRKLLFLALLLAADALAFTASMAAGEGLHRLALAVFWISPPGRLAAFGLSAPGFAAGMAVTLTVFAFEKLYVRRFSFWEEARRIVKSFDLAVLLLAVIEMLPGAHPFYPAPTLALAWLAGLSLVLLSPLLLALAAAVKIDSRGPVIHSHIRLGRKDRTFRILKLRSMFVDAAARLAEFLARRPEAVRELEEFRKIKIGDPRPTRVGRWLRKRSLDELPQLVNVLRGDMSLVGPRPYLPEEKDKLGEMSSVLRAVRPGLTGPWQVGGRNDLAFEARVAMDDDYVRNWSLWLDMIIRIKPVGVWIKGDGAY